MSAPAALHGPGAGRRAAPALTPAELSGRLGRLHPPTDEQAAVIGAPLTDSLVVAGAGSGKTETMAARVVYLVATRQVRPAEVLGLTFTRRAAGELAGRIDRRLVELFAADPELAAEVAPADRSAAVSTYDAFAAEVVADHGLRLGLEPGARLLRPAQAWQLADRLVRGWDGSFQEYEPGVSTVVEVVRSLHDQLAAHCLDVGRLRSHLAGLCRRLADLPGPPAKRRRDGSASKTFPSTALATKFTERQRARLLLLDLVEAYGRGLADAGAVDFATIAASAARLAEQVPEVAAGQHAARRLVLLDEFQDTSPAQLRLVTGAFRDVAVTAVGDPHQSIYGWRGAGADTLGAFRHARRIAQVSPLSVTFRNDRAVLAAANVLSGPLAAVSRVEVAALAARPGAGDGQLAVALFRTRAEESAELVRRVRAAWRARTDGHRSSVAVLVRTRAQVEPLLDALRAGDVEVEVVGLAGLLGVPVVVEVVSVLRVLGDPDRGDALIRLLTGARWRIGPRDLDALAGLARRLRRRPGSRSSAQPVDGEPVDGEEVRDPRLLPPEGEPEPGIVDALDTLAEDRRAGSFSAAGRERLTRLARELRDLRSRVDAPLGELVADVVATTGLGTELAAAAATATALAAPAGRSPAGTREDLAAFVEEAERYAGHGGDRDRGALLAFLAYLDVAEERERGLERADGPEDPDPDPDADLADVAVPGWRVQLLTVHASKGLEWDAVFLPGVVDEVFPNTGRSVQGWIIDLGQLPHALRGDAEELPSLDTDRVADRGELNTALDEHREQMGQVREREERRLAYVAVTRARHLAVVTGHRWGTTTRARKVSPFLAELAAAARAAAAGTGWELGPWVDGDPGERPEPDDGPSALWPGALFAPERAALVEAGAALVTGQLDRVDDVLDVPGTAEEVDWARDVDLLLAERDQLAPPPGTPVPVELPTALSVSALVALGRDPDGLGLTLRRPVPREPRPATRLGTRFHAWLEQRWAGERLIDVDELPGAADDADAVAPVLDDETLRGLQEAFARSPWADRTPTEVEYPFAMSVGDGLVLRGRIDAVFRDEATGRVEVVDWKTGPPPAGPGREREVAVQLAAYRLAWHRATGTPLAAITGAFHHVAAGVTVRPADLLDEAGLLGLVARLPAADE